MYTLIAVDHCNKQDRGDRQRVTHLKSGNAVVFHVVHNGVHGIVRRGEADVLGDLNTDTESTGDGHDGGKEHLGLDVGEGDIPQLLPTGLDSVHHTGLILRAVHVLQTRNEGKEAGTDRAPQDNADDHVGHDNGIFKELYRGVNETPLQKHRVDHTLGVAGEDILKDVDAGQGGDGRGVEEDGEDRTDLRRKLIDEPGKDQGQQVTARTDNGRKDQGVLDGDDKEVIFHKEAVVVVKTCPRGRLQDVVVRQRKCQCCNDRSQDEDKE